MSNVPKMTPKAAPAPVSNLAQPDPAWTIVNGIDLPKHLVAQEGIKIPGAAILVALADI